MSKFARYEAENHSIFHGDSLAILSEEIAPESVDVIFLDPPYNIGLILDPFAGTFTCAAVAKRLRRFSMSIESQEEYVKIGLRRILGWTEYKEEKLIPIRKNNKNTQTTQEGLFNANSTA